MVHRQCPWIDAGVRSTWYLVLGTWYLVLGTWYLALGTGPSVSASGRSTSPKFASLKEGNGQESIWYFVFRT